MALSIALICLTAAGTVSAAAYGFARWYLVGQREASALTRAALDSRAVDAVLVSGGDPGDALTQVPSVGTSLPMVRVGDAWYTASVTLQPDALPPSLLALGVAGGGQMRFAVEDDAYLGVALPVESGLYVEVFPISDLDRTLTWGGWILLVLTAFTALLGAAIGASLAGRVLGPLGRLRIGARQIASGALGTRIGLTGDSDLDPIADAFNEMAEAVEDRIARERRFSANVSHELRSPVTSSLATAELLERQSDALPEREARLVTLLVSQMRRMSKVLLDLLEISRLTSEDPPQWESANIAGLCREVLAHRGVDQNLVVGDEPVVRTDARRLERIVGNLVDNAERHGGGLTLLLIERDAQNVRIRAEDSGPGVDPDVRERLFEPFARGASQARTEGAGLGLAIVREQAHALGGEVHVESPAAGGARFVVDLPIMKDEP
ncbi:MAG: HAMP domain-containing sensor histidine kinase [Actinomycetota bacterium]|nr:HAMP domain-containing sensor histidine kinase [Actinomycetota bacterium]